MRGCGAPLTETERALACDRGHAFDRARSGYVNLLQPADSRARSPGDGREAVAARRRALEAGAGEALAAAVGDLVEAHAGAGCLAVLDVGCGDGFFLRALAARRAIRACGVDISAIAADAAARRQPAAIFVVANADRALPWADGTFDVALSITARRPASELRRVLRPAGLLVVAVPAAGDLGELRAAVLGRAEERERQGPAIELAPAFDLIDRREVRERRTLEAPILRDLLAATYRGARLSQGERAAALETMAVTLAHDLFAFRPRGAPSPEVSA